MKKLILALSILLGAVFVLIFGLGIIMAFRYFNVPVYTMSQQPSAYPNFTMTILTLGSQTYVSDYTEFRLQASSSSYSMRIGRTNDGFDIYRVPGQDPKDYLVTSGDMMPNFIFRNSQLPPFDPQQAGIDEIQFRGSANPQLRSSHDPALIAEVLQSLQQPWQPNPAGGQSSITTTLYLASSQLRGLQYILYAARDAQGNIYLENFNDPGYHVPAGSLLTQWIQP